MMAASRSNRSSGWRVTSAASSGVLHKSKKGVVWRIPRYSAIYRPAWRMSQMGVYGVGSRRQALRKMSCSIGDSLVFMVNDDGLPNAVILPWGAF